MFRKAGAPAVANKALVVVVLTEIVDGQTPAPPPITTPFAARSVEVFRFVADVKHATPPLVPATV